jgi:D-alanine-D-alanine ligase
MKTRVAILYGGPSREHDVSVASAKNILAHIDRDSFLITELFISREGLCNLNHNNQPIEQLIPFLKNKCDIVFPVLHGTFGEDGTLQQLLEDAGIPFVGSGSITSRIAINKQLTHDVFSKHGIRTPKSQIISKESLVPHLSFPIIIKPISEGSSIGIYKCGSLEDYQRHQESFFHTYSQMIAQEYIMGREFTCGVLETKGTTLALPVTEIVLTSTKLFDYSAKYISDLCNEITPAPIDHLLKKAIQDTVLKCHTILGCRSISRTDVIVTQTSDIYVLELNTLPGMTPTSLIPAQAQAAGISIKQLITNLLTTHYQ